MLDAFKKLTSPGKGPSTQAPAESLRDLLAAAGDERIALSTMLTQIELRSAKVSQALKALADLEDRIRAAEQRIEDLSRAAEEVDHTIRSIVAADGLLAAVRTELEAVQQMSARATVEFEYATAHRQEVATLKTHVDELLDRMAEIDQRSGIVEAHRKTVADVQRQVRAIATQLNEIRTSVATEVGRRGTDEEGAGRRPSE